MNLPGGVRIAGCERVAKRYKPSLAAFLCQRPHCFRPGSVRRSTARVHRRVMFRVAQRVSIEACATSASHDMRAPGVRRTAEETRG